LSEYMQFAGAMGVAVPGWDERASFSKDGRA
jgi:hypothetical protein